MVWLSPQLLSQHDPFRRRLAQEPQDAESRPSFRTQSRMSHTSGGSRLSPHKWSSFRAKRASLLLLASGTCIELSGPRTPEQQTPSRHEHHLENRICAPVIGTLSPGSKAETLRSES